jgi:hypothetical protein
VHFREEAYSTDSEICLTLIGLAVTTWQSALRCNHPPPSFLTSVYCRLSLSV